MHAGRDLPPPPHLAPTRRDTPLFPTCCPPRLTLTLPLILTPPSSSLVVPVPDPIKTLQAATHVDKRDEFRKYLEKTRVVHHLTQSLTDLFEMDSRPENPLVYIHARLGDVIAADPALVAASAPGAAAASPSAAEAPATSDAPAAAAAPAPAAASTVGADHAATAAAVSN
jgi:hypothetical protein